MATITAVHTSPDLGQATISVSVLPTDRQETILQMLNNQAGHIRHLLGQKLSIRKIPKITFVFDDTEEKASHIEALIDKIQHHG